MRPKAFQLNYDKELAEPRSYSSADLNIKPVKVGNSHPPKKSKNHIRVPKNAKFSMNGIGTTIIIAIQQTPYNQISTQGDPYPPQQDSTEFPAATPKIGAVIPAIEKQVELATLERFRTVSKQLASQY